MHCLSLSTALVTTLVHIFLAGSTGDFFCVEAHSTPLSPFLKGDNVERSASATIITSIVVPRGGALSTDSKLLLRRSKRTKAVLSGDGNKENRKNSISKKTTGWLQGRENAFNLIPEGKGGWYLALLLSVVYLGLLLNKTLKPDCDYTSQGFCVYGFDPAKQECTQGMNSHVFSWWVDAVFTFLVIAIGKWTKATTGDIVSLVAVVLMHGLLHKHSDFKSCKVGLDPTPGFDPSVLFGNVTYFVFTALVSIVGLKKTELSSTTTNLIALGIAAATSILSQPAMGNGASPIFMTTQLLVSIIGSLDKNNQFSSLMGNLFVLPCAVSIVELMLCCGVFHNIGGHVWYDLTLHTSLLATFYKPEKKE